MTDSDVASPDPGEGRTDPDEDTSAPVVTGESSDRRGTEESDGRAPEAERTTPDGRTADQPTSLGWRGWVLVGALVVSFLVVPWAIILLPRAQGFLGSVGLGWRDAYLVLPLIPALGLGVLAVWAAVAARRDG